MTSVDSEELTKSPTLYRVGLQPVSSGVPACIERGCSLYRVGFQPVSSGVAACIEWGPTLYRVGFQPVSSGVPPCIEWGFQPVSSGGCSLYRMGFQPVSSGVPAQTHQLFSLTEQIGSQSVRPWSHGPHFVAE